MILSLGSAALYEYSFIPHHSRDMRKQCVKSIFPVVTDEEAERLSTCSHCAYGKQMAAFQRLFRKLTEYPSPMTNSLKSFQSAACCFALQLISLTHSLFRSKTRTFV